MRYEQGRWSEDRIIDSVNATDGYRAIPYGRSAVGPSDRSEIAAYWEDYRKAESVGKRPDILVLPRARYEALANHIHELRDTTLATDDELEPVLESAVCGIEAENSLWRAGRMPDFGISPIPKSEYVAPSIWLKEQDAEPLASWMKYYRIPVCIVQVFLDQAYLALLQDVLGAVREIRREISRANSDSDARARQRAIEMKLGVKLHKQPYADSRSGSSSKKLVYRTHHLWAIKFGELDPDDMVGFKTAVIEGENGKIMPYVTFSGGTLIISEEAVALFDRLEAARGRK